MNEVSSRGGMRRIVAPLPQLYRALILLIIGGLFPIASIDALSLSVSFLQGSAHMEADSIWSPLSIGESIPQDAIVRLGDRSFLELTGPGIDITLDQPGTYHVAELAAESNALASAGVGQALSSTFANLLSATSGNASATMGVRGENRGGPSKGGWFSSEAQVYLQAGKSYLKFGKCEKAIEQFREGLSAAEPSELPELHFYLADAFSLEGKTVSAVKELKGIAVTSNGSWKQDFLLLKARLLVDSYAYERGMEWLTGPAKDLSADTRRAPAYYLLLGAAYRGLGETQKARENLVEAARMGGNSAVGQAAKKLVADLHE